MKINESAPWFQDGECVYSCQFTDANDVIEYGFNAMNFTPDSVYYIRKECGVLCADDEGKSFKNCSGYLSPIQAVAERTKKGNLKYILAVVVAVFIGYLFFKKRKK